MRLATSVKNPLSTLKFERKTISYVTVCDTILELLLYVNCFFPFLKFIYFGSDTQPYALLAGILIVVVSLWRERTMPKGAALLLLLGILMGAFAIIGFSQIGAYRVFRSYAVYATLMFIPAAAFFILKWKGGLNEGVAKLCIFIWFFVGFMQNYVDSSFGYSLIVRHTTNLTRGVVGLATEPSTYGYMCMFMLLVAMQFQKKKALYIALLLIQICVFAGSSVTLVYLAAYVFAYLLNEIVQARRYIALKIALVVGCAAFGIFYVRNYVPKTNRIRVLVDYVFENPAKFFNDGSIKLRINDIVESFSIFWSNAGIPDGLSEYKYMSGVGLVLLEAGFIGVLILALIAVIIWRGYPKRYRLMYTLGFMVMMVSAIPFSAPLCSFYLGVCLYHGWEMKNQSLEEPKIEGSLDM